jgi:hypothetical protein
MTVSSLYMLCLWNPHFQAETGSAPSDDVMDMEASFKVPSKGKRKSYEIEYNSLSQESVDKLAQQDVDHISGIFGVDVSPFFEKTDSFLRNESGQHRIPTLALHEVE